MSIEWLMRTESPRWSFDFSATVVLKVLHATRLQYGPLWRDPPSMKKRTFIAALFGILLVSLTSSVYADDTGEGRFSPLPGEDTTELGVEDAGPDEASEPVASTPEPEPEPEVEARPAAPDMPDSDELPRLEDGQVVVNQRAGTEYAPSLHGLSGVFRTISARSAPPGSILFGAHMGGYYLSEEWDNAAQTHGEARAHFSYSILDELDVHLGLIATGHRASPQNDSLSTEFMQTLGDLTLGGKYVYPWRDYLSFGGALDFRLYTKVRNLGPRWGSVSVAPVGLVTFDAREHPDLEWPLIAHANVGYFLDNGYKAVLDDDNDGLAFQGDLTASRLTGLNVNAGDQVLLRFALEFPQEDYTVFLEYTTEQEVNNRLGRGVEKSGWSASPQRFTPGVRWNFAHRLILDAAVDLSPGIAGDYQVNGVSARATSPYQLWLGLAYSHEPEGQEVVDTRGFVRGVVVDAETGEPLEGAIVQYQDMAFTRQITEGDEGEFRSFPLLPGQARIRIEREEYEPVVIAPNVLSRETITERILLRRIDDAGQVVGALVGSVLDPSAEPVEATLSFVDVDITGARSNPVDGSFVKIMPPGEYQVRVEAEGFQSRVFLVPIEPRRRTRVVFELPPVGVDTTLGAMAGVLEDPDGNPVGGTIHFPDGEANPVQADPATGEFLAQLPAGRYRIEVRAEGYSTRAYLVPVETGRRTRIDVQLAPEREVGAIEGRLVTVDGEPLGGTVRFVDERHEPIVSDPETGQFYQVLPAGTYDVEMRAPGLGTKEVKLRVLPGRRTVQDFTLGQDDGAPLLARLTANSIDLARPISLPKGGVSLSAADREILDTVAEIVQANPERTISIVAYTDDEGSARENLQETQAQAEAVLDYLVSQGADRSRLRAVGAGQENPLASNATEEGRAQNRRIEFRVR